MTECQYKNDCIEKKMYRSNCTNEAKCGFKVALLTEKLNQLMTEFRTEKLSIEPIAHLSGNTCKYFMIKVAEKYRPVIKTIEVERPQLVIKHILKDIPKCFAKERSEFETIDTINCRLIVVVWNNGDTN